MNRCNALLGLGVILAGLSWTSQAALVYDFTDKDATLSLSETINRAESTRIFFEAINNTGVTWTDFHLETNLDLSLGQVGGFTLNTYADGPPDSFWDINDTGSFLTTKGDELNWEGYTGLNIQGLSVADKDTLTFSIEVLYCTENTCGFDKLFGGSTDVAFSAFPTFDSTSGGDGTGDGSAGIPEPPLIFLFGAGLVALYSFSRKSTGNQLRAA